MLRVSRVRARGATKQNRGSIEKETNLVAHNPNWKMLRNIIRNGGGPAIVRARCFVCLVLFLGSLRAFRKLSLEVGTNSSMMNHFKEWFVLRCQIHLFSGTARVK